FFFSSRRRHTRLQGDWSSDVCSSDLGRARRRRCGRAVPRHPCSRRARRGAGAAPRWLRASRALPAPSPDQGEDGRLTRISFVLAFDRNHVIGKGGGLPWRLPDDMRRVRALTVGKPLIMGRRTYDSIGRPLPDRISIVLTRDPAFRCEGCLIARTPDEALALAGDVPEVIVFGGAGVFR